MLFQNICQAFLWLFNIFVDLPHFPMYNIYERMVNTMKIKDRIKEIRRKNNLTQQEFANKLGIKRNTIATYETGKSNPSDSAVVLICKEFNISEDWLRNGKGEMSNPTAESELDALTKKYGLSYNARILIEKFINLKSEQQDAVINYIKDIARALDDSDITSPLSTNTTTTEIASDNESSMKLSITVEEAEAEYIKSISNFAKNTTFTASNTIKNTGKKINNENKIANQ